MKVISKLKFINLTILQVSPVPESIIAAVYSKVLNY
jgi:hypothetical protein